MTHAVEVDAPLSSKEVKLTAWPMKPEAKYILYAQSRYLGRLRFDSLLGLAKQLSSQHLQSPAEEDAYEQNCMWYHYHHVVFNTNHG